MGEIADMMLEGILCQYCGEYLGDGDGFPQSCSCCGGDDEDDLVIHRNDMRVIPESAKAPKVWGCTGCKKMFRKKAHAAAHCKDAGHGEPVDTTAKVKP